VVHGSTGKPSPAVVHSDIPVGLVPQVVLTVTTQPRLEPPTPPEPYMAL